MFDFERIDKECFWDITMSEESFYQAIQSQEIQKKQYIFEKILLNSTKMLNDLKNFSKADLEILIDSIKIPNFNKAHVLRRKNLVEVYFFDKELKIDELKWVA